MPRSLSRPANIEVSKICEGLAESVPPSEYNVAFDFAKRFCKLPVLNKSTEAYQPDEPFVHDTNRVQATSAHTSWNFEPTGFRS